jgi:hypothetical protein
VAIYSVRYRCRIVDGLNVEVPTGDGNVEERTLNEGDIVFVFGGASGNHTPDNYGDLYYVVDGKIEVAPADVKPGDLVISNCSPVDLPTQSGTAVVICLDQTFTDLSSPGPGDTSDTITVEDSPHAITTSIVVADTTLGNVVGILPDHSTPRTIRAANLTGTGTFDLQPAEGQQIDGADYLTLSAGEKATLVATGTTWEVW